MANPADPLEGQQVGRYRVLRTIGYGGMGTVVLAERADGQFQQQVAIKLVRHNLVSQHLESRLKLEREILATLDHPNIAKLLDGGVADDGTPYIVMEYVDGVPIDLYCDQHRLSISDRLRLLRQVCAAVHSAHQRLIVHRDLKPSNILVTAEGTPKLLDFGIAKLLDERQMLHTLALTQADLRLLTPDHASPEQIQGLPITTASDIYVLGVLLYELLTGRRPFDITGLRFAEIERAICEQAPPAPSVIVATTFSRYTREQVEQLAADRSTSIVRLRKQLRGDLDKIVLMAMRKEPERRYSSVEQLAADIERYLSHLPVLAHGDTVAYRTAKFVQRHTAAVALASLLILALAAFAVTAALQADRISKERDAVTAQREIAEQERTRAQQVSDFLVNLFEVSDPERAQGRDVTAREILDTGSKRLTTEMKNQPLVRAALQETIGRVYLKLGLLPEAERHLEQALAARERRLRETDPDIASSLAAISRLREQQGRLNEAESAARRALTLASQAPAPDQALLSRSLHDLGLTLLELGKPQAAETAFKQALGIAVQRFGPEASETTEIMNDLGLAFYAQGRIDTAISHYQRALELTRKRDGENHPLVAFTLNNLAMAYQDQGDLGRAEDALRQALSVDERVLGPEHPDSIDMLGALGSLLQEKGDLDGAESVFQRALQLDRKVRGPEHSYVGHDLSQLAALESRRGHHEQAERLLVEALAVFRKALPEEHPYIASGMANLGRTLVDQNRAVEAETLLRRAIESERVVFGPESDAVAMAQISLARALLQLRRHAEAEKLFTESYPIIFNTRGRSAHATQSARQWIIGFYGTVGRPEAAAAYLAEVESKEPPP